MYPPSIINCIILSQCAQGGGNFSQFVLRNRALAENVGVNSGSNTNLYYSFNTPDVHWVAFTAETWTMSAQQVSPMQSIVITDNFCPVYPTSHHIHDAHSPNRTLCLPHSLIN